MSQNKNLKSLKINTYNLIIPTQYYHSFLKYLLIAAVASIKPCFTGPTTVENLYGTLAHIIQIMTESKRSPNWRDLSEQTFLSLVGSMHQPHPFETEIKKLALAEQERQCKTIKDIEEGLYPIGKRDTTRSELVIIDKVLSQVRHDLIMPQPPLVQSSNPLEVTDKILQIARRLRLIERLGLPPDFSDDQVGDELNDMQIRCNATDSGSTKT